MLLNYSFANYGLFLDWAAFSMQPSQEINRYKDNEVNFGRGIRVLKSAVIAGANGGGKTTIARNMRTLQELLSASNQVLKVLRRTVNVNLQSEFPDASQKYELEAIITANTKAYIYHFILELDGRGIVQESLSRRETLNKKEEKIYSTNRVGGVKLNPKYFSSVEPFKNNLQEFQLGAMLNRVVVFCPEVVAPFIEWLRDSLVIECVELSDPLNHFTPKPDGQTLEIIRSNRFLNLFQLVDTFIKRIDVNPKDPYHATKIIRRTENDEEYAVPLRAESAGIREFFYWAEKTWKILYENKTVFADDMDRVIDPLVVNRLVARVNNSKHKWQLVFTTRNMERLDFQNFSKEQMWIASNGKGLRAGLFSIADFSDLFSAWKVRDE